MRIMPWLVSRFMATFSSATGFMKLGQPVKILVGLATVWSVVYPFLFMAVWFSMFFGMGLFSPNARGPSPLFLTGFFAIFPVHCLTMVILIALATFTMDMIYPLLDPRITYKKQRG